MAKKLVVPYPGSFKQAAKGAAPLAVKRALRHAGLLDAPKTGFTETFGAAATVALRKFQKRNDVKRGLGTYTRPTHDALVVHRHFDAWGAHLMQVATKAKRPDPRKGVVAAAMYALAHAPRHYSQDMNLRMQGLLNRVRPPDMWDYSDCSGFATWCYWVGTGGKTDPNGWGFDGYPAHDMFTGSMARHGTVVSLEHAKPGDLVLYGAAPSFEHVAVYVGHRRVVSHGHEGGPLLLDIDYRGDRSQIRSYLG